MNAGAGEKPIASLSLDLDNKWSYMKTHGDAGWELFPTYLDIVVPRVLAFLKDRDVSITFFIVGQDAVLEKNGTALRAIAEAGHEIGNHSFHHEPWLHLYSPAELELELARAEEAIESATGQRPIGFRGPGFSCSAATLETLARRGYVYDASTFPTFLGPAARAYYFLSTRLGSEQRRERARLFGTVMDGFRPLKPYRWQTPGGSVLEIPVTTMPFIRAPIHMSYLLFLGCFSSALMLSYFRMAIWLCQRSRTPLSLLLHPLDFMGIDDVPELGFFPGMRMPGPAKLHAVSTIIDRFLDQFHVVPMRVHARDAEQSHKLAVKTPR